MTLHCLKVGFLLLVQKGEIKPWHWVSMVDVLETATENKEIVNLHESNENLHTYFTYSLTFTKFKRLGGTFLRKFSSIFKVFHQFYSMLYNHKIVVVD